MITSIDAVRSLHGRVKIIRRNDATGEVIVSGGNLVVNNLYSQLAYLLANDASARAITKAEFGSSKTAAAVTDTHVTHLTPVAYIAMAATYGSYSVTFTGSWASAASSASDIGEVGLLFADNSLAARYTFDYMKKSAGWTWTIEWTLYYTVV